MQFFNLAITAAAIAASVVGAMPSSGRHAEAESLGKGRRYQALGYATASVATTWRRICHVRMEVAEDSHPSTLLTNVRDQAKSRGGGDGERCDVYNFGSGKAYVICPGH
ncbi:hypothetical protein PG994_006555 [Apiospora phragmitis]|uniref:Uncharacterized protein n=1 Tax=Apiospora phragmitis TaxID=2905665 RepID=A0ABR1VFD9_9PEZI